MSSPPSTARTDRGGPVSDTLLAELRCEAREHGLLVWLDRDGVYTDFVDDLIARRAEGDPRLASEFPYPVHAFRRSWLELLTSLGVTADGAVNAPALIHVPGANEEWIARTPLYEAYCAGRRHRVALDTLVERAATGRVPPSEIEGALRPGFESLAEADDWLAAKLRGEHDELAGQPPTQLADELLGGARSGISTRLSDPGLRERLLRHLERSLGLSTEWREAMAWRDTENAAEWAFLLASWALSVEFVHDLSREPKDEVLVPLRRLPAKLVDACRELAGHLRERHPAGYQRDATEIELAFERERAEATADDLGKTDTFPFEEALVFRAALEALAEGRYADAAGYARERSEGRSFWVSVRADGARRAAWRLVLAASTLGEECRRHAAFLEEAQDAGDAAERYAVAAWTADRAHRHLEQEAYHLPVVQVDEFPDLLEQVDGVRRVYRKWADRIAIAFNRLCKAQGFLPRVGLQQRTVFEEVVRPLTRDGEGPVAYFVVDALRYEMARQLHGAIPHERDAKVELAPRLAELPTVTDVGMNVLAPVARDGALEPEVSDHTILGFRAGEARVSSTKTRQKAMHERAGGETCPWLSLDDVLEKSTATLRRQIARAKLVVVHSRQIDIAGESGGGLGQYERELQRIRHAWDRLRTAGVFRFILTADHGFLIQDKVANEKLVAHGPKSAKLRRHAIGSLAVDHEGEVRVSTRELGYVGPEIHFTFPESSRSFDGGEGAKDFVHGGNSLQERVIPVLTAEYRRPQGERQDLCVITAQGLNPAMGLHRLRGMLQPGPQMLSISIDDEVELQLVALDGDGVEVELVDATGGRVVAGALAVKIGQEFELSFRLTGRSPHRASLQLRSALESRPVAPFTIPRRFAIDVLQGTRKARDLPGEKPPEEKELSEAGPSGSGTSARRRPEDDSDTSLPAWTTEIPEEYRGIFVHIDRYGAISEADATKLLASGRKFRQFSLRFEEFAQRVPFGVRIDVHAGTKRYVRED